MSAKTVFCGPCARRFCAWFKDHSNKRYGCVKGVRGSGVNFYEHATWVDPRVWTPEGPVT